MVLGGKELVQTQRGHLAASYPRNWACQESRGRPRGGGQKHHSVGHAEFKSGVINASVSGGQAGKQTRQALAFGKR